MISQCKILSVRFGRVFMTSCKYFPSAILTRKKQGLTRILIFVFIYFTLYPMQQLFLFFSSIARKKEQVSWAAICCIPTLYCLQPTQHTSLSSSATDGCTRRTWNSEQILPSWSTASFCINLFNRLLAFSIVHTAMSTDDNPPAGELEPTYPSTTRLVEANNSRRWKSFSLKKQWAEIHSNQNKFFAVWLLLPFCRIANMVHFWPVV